MTRRTHHPPTPYRRRRTRRSDDYRQPTDESELDVLARAYSLYLDEKDGDQ